MVKLVLSISSLLDKIGKVGVFLISGGIAGSVFTHTVSLLIGGISVLIGFVFAIIGSFEEASDKEKR